MLKYVKINLISEENASLARPVYVWKENPNIKNPFIPCTTL